MKLRLTKYREQWQNCFVYLVPGGAVKWNDPGDVREVPDAQAVEIMKRYPDMFEKVTSESAPKKTYDPKMIAAAPKNKAAAAKSTKKKPTTVTLNVKKAVQMAIGKAAE